MVEAKVTDDLVEDLFAVGGAQHGQTLDAGRPLEHFSSTGRSQAGLPPLTHRARLYLLHSGRGAAVREFPHKAGRLRLRLASTGLQFSSIKVSRR